MNYFIKNKKKAVLLFCFSLSLSLQTLSVECKSENEFTPSHVDRVAVPHVTDDWGKTFLSGKKMFKSATEEPKLIASTYLMIFPQKNKHQHWSFKQSTLEKSYEKDRRETEQSSENGAKLKPQTEYYGDIAGLKKVNPENHGDASLPHNDGYADSSILVDKKTASSYTLYDSKLKTSALDKDKTAEFLKVEDFKRDISEVKDIKAYLSYSSRHNDYYVQKI